MQEKAAEIATTESGAPILSKDGKPITNAEMFVEAWMKDRKQRRDFAAYAWGKPKEEIDVSANVAQELTIKIVKASDVTGNNNQ